MQFIMFSSYTIATTIDTLQYSHVAKMPESNIFDICNNKKTQEDC